MVSFNWGKNEGLRTHCIVVLYCMHILLSISQFGNSKVKLIFYEDIFYKQSLYTVLFDVHYMHIKDYVIFCPFTKWKQHTTYMEGSDGKIEANMTTCCSKLDKIAYNCKLIYRVVNLRMIFAVYIIVVFKI